MPRQAPPSPTRDAAVRPAGEARRDVALIRTINQLGHDLGLETVAEGIETREQEQLIRDLGVDFGQGFLYSAPLVRDALERFLDEIANEVAVTASHS